jgi:hypothetical protein
LQVGKASKEYYIQFCQERVCREREVLLILKRDNLYSTEFMKFAIFYSLLNDNQYYYKTLNSAVQIQIQYNVDTGTQNIIELEILPPSVLQNVN